jgi:hypothetical protein
MEHEQALVHAFIAPTKRKRYLDRLASPKARGRFLANRLYHMTDLDSRYAERLDPGMPLVPLAQRHDAHIVQIYQLLRDRGAPETCFVISTDEDLDGGFHDLRSVLHAVVGSGSGTLISCLPGRLAYYEGEDANERFILER